MCLNWLWGVSAQLAVLSGRQRPGILMLPVSVCLAASVWDGGGEALTHPHPDSAQNLALSSQGLRQGAVEECHPVFDFKMFRAEYAEPVSQNHIGDLASPASH